MAIFVQDKPKLGNQYTDDPVLEAYVNRKLADPPTSQLEQLGNLAGGELFDLQMETLNEEPELTRWSPWGERIDRIDHTPTWKRASELARTFSLVGTAYRDDESAARLKQFAKVFLFAPSTDTYTCPLAMTDGAGRALLDSGNDELINRAVPRLKGTEEPNWTSGQWMTETSGGSDVSRSHTTARREDGEWRLYGRKWFTSAIDSDMALTLAKPNDTENDEMALFYVETRDERDRPRNFRITRLKDKLGTRELPTGEIILEGTPAEPVSGLTGGVASIYPLLNVTRVWNAVCSAAGMRRGLALAESYAGKRTVFGDPLSEKPLHQSVMDSLEAETQGAFHLAFEAGRLLDEDRKPLKRVVIPLAKLYTAKQATSVTSETIELFGGAGYVEDTGLPKLLRDAQVLPIWEGTTNVLSLEVLRQVADPDIAEGFLEWARKKYEQTESEKATSLAKNSFRRIDESIEWVQENLGHSEELQRQARDLSYSLARSLEILLLAEQGDWERTNDLSSGAFKSAKILLDRNSFSPGEPTSASPEF